MKNKTTIPAKILALPSEKINSYPAYNMQLSTTPEFTLDYAYTQENQQEMEDFIDSIPSMSWHSDATSIGDIGLISTNPRPDAHRHLNATLLQFDLNKEVETIKHERNWANGNQSAKTLLKSDFMSVVLVAMPFGNEINMHHANGSFTLQVLEGNIQFMTRQNCLSIQADQLITLQKKTQHNLVAKQQSIILLTLMNDPSIKKEKEVAKKELEEHDKETLEKSENINFPDFPTYPAKDDIYKAPIEPEPKE